MSPINGFKRMFGMQGLVELLKAIGKFLVVGVSTYVMLSFGRSTALTGALPQ